MHRMLPNNGHKATRDFSPFFYTRYSKSEHTAQLEILIKLIAITLQSKVDHNTN